MKLKVIIFDFDGTIANTFDTLAKIINRLATEFGYLPASPEKIAEFRNSTASHIVQSSGVSIFQLPFIIKKVKRELNQEIHLLKPIDGIKEVLIDLHEQGYQLGIITSNSAENVEAFLSSNNLKYLFSFLSSGTTLFGKNRIINKFLRQQNLRLEQAIYVGDEIRDIEAAKRSNIKVIAVSWGFNSKEILAQHEPDFLIDEPKQLREAIASLQVQLLGKEKGQEYAPSAGCANRSSGVQEFRSLGV
ncbi:MAG: HAD-IA family hydrolase [Cyanosarcina radialis HA8281-LM2]|jgi:HAD superfamily hydrolase (TIGR01549 family)|nr:HAD-IA family hydrolase [Cyanosarcina radialis HA8281-LM2]